MAVADKALVIYDEIELTAIEVFKGEQYWIPENIKIFEGSLKEFLEENKEYNANT